ncbi:MAG: protein kinase [Lentisphaeraceae bacterium]|nr:protein kinase [Lentisphaeraceae bacterium]
MSFHSGLGIPVAVKILKPHLIEEDPEFLDRFIQEGRLAVSLHHKNIVRIFDAGKAGDSYYLVMELLEGKDALETLSSQGAFSVEKTLKIGCAVADALIEAHEHGIIHRDIKPDNILISSEGKIKLADLGLAKKLGDEYSSTISGATIGTPNYMSPEQALNSREADARSDIYSLGATLYHLLTGTLPFEGNSIMEVMMKHANAPLDAPQERKGGLPTKICNVIVKMMDKNPDKRYQSCEEVLTALNKIRYAPSADEKPKTHTLKTKKFKSPAINTVNRQSPKTASAQKSNKAGLIAIFGTALLIPLLALFLPDAQTVSDTAGTPQTSNKAEVKAPHLKSEVKKLPEKNIVEEEPGKNLLADFKIPDKYAKYLKLKDGILIINPRNKFLYAPFKGLHGNCRLIFEYKFHTNNTYGKIGLLSQPEQTVNVLFSTPDCKKVASGSIQLKSGKGENPNYNYVVKVNSRHDSPAGEWNTLEAVLNGTKLDISVNGQYVSSYKADNIEGKMIILADPKAQLTIRKFLIKPLK